MLDIIKDELRSGEKVLWSGKPEEFETMDVSHKTPFIRNAVLIIGIVSALCLLYIMYASSKGITIKPGIVVIALGAAIAGSLNGIFNAKKLRRATYFITDQRIISIIDRPKFVEYKNIKDIQFKKDAAGHSSLLCGGRTIKSKEHTWRSLSLTDAYIDSESGICERFALYAVPEADKVKKILSDFLPL